MSDDPRLGDHVKQGADGALVIVGYPCDVGVARNNGRVGAKDGPDAVRK
jgi:formiminoglutamase